MPKITATKVVLLVDEQYVESESFEEVTTLPNYVPTYDLRPGERPRPMGWYIATPMVRCGLCAHHQLHAHGWVFETEGGDRFNVGQDCASDHLGVVFQTDRREWQEKYQLFGNRRLVARFQHDQVPKMLERVDSLRSSPLGVTWAIETIRRLTEDELPLRVKQLLDDMARNDDPRIYITRIATEVERDVEERRRKKEIKGPYYVDQPVGLVEGSEILHEDLRKLVDMEIRDYLIFLTTFDCENATELQVHQMAKFVRAAESKFQRAEHALQTARRFLTQRNLMQFARGKLSSAEIAKLRQAVSDLPSGDLEAA